MRALVVAGFLIAAAGLSAQIVISPGGSLTIHKPRSGGSGLDPFNCPIGVGGGPLTSSVLGHWTFDTQTDSGGGSPDTYCDSSPNAFHLTFTPGAVITATGSTVANGASVTDFLGTAPPNLPPAATPAASAVLGANFADADWMVCGFVKTRSIFPGFGSFWTHGTNTAFVYTGVHLYGGAFGVPPPTNDREGPGVDIDAFFVQPTWNPPGDAPGDSGDTWFWVCVGQDGGGLLHVRYNDQPGLTCPDPVACEGGSGVAATFSFATAPPVIAPGDLFAVLGVQNTTRTGWLCDGFSGPPCSDMWVDELTVFDHYLSPAEYSTLIGGVGFTYAAPPVGPGNAAGPAYFATNAIKRYPFD